MGCQNSNLVGSLKFKVHVRNTSVIGSTLFIQGLMLDRIPQKKCRDRIAQLPFERGLSDSRGESALDISLQSPVVLYRSLKEERNIKTVDLKFRYGAACAEKPYLIFTTYFSHPNSRITTLEDRINF